MKPRDREQWWLDAAGEICRQFGYEGESRDASMMLCLSAGYGADPERVIGLAGVEPAAGLNIARRFFEAGVWNPDGTGQMLYVPVLGTEREVRWHCLVMVGLGIMRPDPERPGEFALTDYGLRMGRALVEEVAA